MKDVKLLPSKITTKLSIGLETRRDLTTPSIATLTVGFLLTSRSTVLPRAPSCELCERGLANGTELGVGRLMLSQVKLVQNVLDIFAQAIQFAVGELGAQGDCFLDS